MGCYNSIVINASADEVWAKLRNFHDLSWSTNVVNKVDAVGEKGPTDIGAKRVINDAFQETLLSLNDDSCRLTYSIDDGPGPVSKENVSGYIGEVNVFPITAGGGCFVQWTSSWDSTVEGGVAEFCNPIYHALIQDLKGHFG